MIFFKKNAVLLCLYLSLINFAHSGEVINYNPPFKVNAKFLVSQGFGGVDTHQNAINYYAVDLALPYGELVCAARDGVVSDLYDGAGLFFDDIKKSNYVHIQNSNRQIANYEHLKPGSIKVKIGQIIKSRQCFAQVGSTGNTTGPHLHFAVLEEQNNELVSVPFKFIDPNGHAYTPEYLQWVRN
jgi:murein DD-endopeptidase MepM/ murein hydrolase activator NlpD